MGWTKKTGGGGGSSYTLVDTFADLPLATLHPDSIYVVKTASGLWPFNRKPPGMYYSDGATWTYMSAYPDLIKDGNFGIQNTADGTRIIKFDAGSITSGQTRTLTVPDASGTIALVGSYEVPLTFSSGLTRTVNDVKNDLITGKSGGQTIYGGTVSGEDLTIQPNTANTTTGAVIINSGAQCSNTVSGALQVAGGVGVGGDLYAGHIVAQGSGTPAGLSNVMLQSWDSTNSWVQNNIQNLSAGAIASADWIATANNGTDTTNFIDLGINGSGWSSGTWTINGADDGYLYTSSSNLSIGTASAGKNLDFFTGGTLLANKRMSFIDGSYTLMGDLTSATTAITDVLNVGKLVSSGSARAMIVSAESSATVNHSNAIQGLNVIATALPTSSANFTATSSGGGLRSRYGIQHKGSGTVTLATGLQIFSQAGDTTTGNSSIITTLNCFDVATPTMQGTAPSIVNFKAYNVTGGALAVGSLTNRYGLYIENLVGGTNRWGVYQAGATDLNYFAGNTGLGVAANATSKLNASTTISDNLSNPSAYSFVNIFSATTANVTGVETGASFITYANTNASPTYYDHASVRALGGSAYNLGKGVATALYGLQFSAGALDTGNITTAYLCDLSLYGTGSGVITNAIGLRVASMNSYHSDASTISYGINLAANTNSTGSNKYGIYIGGISGASAGNYSIYSVSGDNYFGGRLGIGLEPQTGVQLLVHGTAGTNPVIRISDADCTHPFTAVGFTPEVTAQTAGQITINGSTTGGLNLMGLSSGDNIAVVFSGYIGSNTPTKAPICFRGYKSNGTTGRSDLGATEQLFRFDNGGTASLMTMLGNGNLGIGTTVTAPTALTHIGASTTARASLCLDSGTAPTTPVSGDMWNDSTQQCIRSQASGITKSLSGVIFTQTASATVGNTTTETSVIGTGIGVSLLPANFWTVGKTIRLKMYGNISCTTSDTASVRIKVGSVTVGSSIDDAFPVTLTNSLFIGELIMTCRTTGATGTLFVQGCTTIYASSTADMTTYGRQIVSTATVTIDTTATGQLNATYQWSAARAGNTITSTNATIEVLN